MRMLPLLVEDIFLTGSCNQSNWNLVIKVECFWPCRRQSDIFNSFNTEESTHFTVKKTTYSQKNKGLRFPFTKTSFTGDVTGVIADLEQCKCGTHQDGHSSSTGTEVRVLLTELTALFVSPENEGVTKRLPGC